MDAKELERQKIDEAMKAFLANGGKVYVAKNGESGDGNQEVWFDKNRSCIRTRNDSVKGGAKTIKALYAYDYTGAAFGCFTIVGESKTRVRDQMTWDAKCNCGNVIQVRSETLKRKAKLVCHSCKRSSRDET